MFGDGFEQIDHPPHRPRRADARHHADVMGPAGVGARRGRGGRAARVPAVGGVSPRGAGVQALVGNLLRAADERESRCCGRDAFGF